MKKMLVIVKLRDEIIVPPNLGATVIVGDDYYTAQKQRLLHCNRRKLLLNDMGFWSFYKAFRTFLGDTPLACLYYTSDKIAFARKIGYTHNLLNFFAFPYACNPYEIQSELRKLTSITALPEVEYWWYEGEMTLLSAPVEQRKSTGSRLPASPMPQTAVPDCVQTNGYYSTLSAASFRFRGDNVQLVDAEDYGDAPQHTYLQHLNLTIVDPNSPSEELKSHFYKTLGVLFAQPTGTEQVIGLAPNANLLVFAFHRKPSEVGTIKDFAQNFNQRRLITNTLLIEKATVLLIERAVTLPIGIGQTFRFPIEVLYDIRKLFIKCAQRNLIVVQPAAWQVSQPEPNLNTALPSILREGGVRYTDFGQSFKVRRSICRGSASVLVSSIDANGNIQPDNNRGDLVDLYLWGACIRSLDRNEGFAPFAYSSAATAVAAGIVAALQSAAFDSQKTLPLRLLKKVLTRYFRAGGAVFTPATLQAIWGTLQPLLR